MFYHYAKLLHIVTAKLILKKPTKSHIYFLLTLFKCNEIQMNIDIQGNKIKKLPYTYLSIVFK
jgi:hypothetical protein